MRFYSGQDVDTGSFSFGEENVGDFLCLFLGIDRYKDNYESIFQMSPATDCYLIRIPVNASPIVDIGSGMARLIN